MVSFMINNFSNDVVVKCIKVSLFALSLSAVSANAGFLSKLFGNHDNKTSQETAKPAQTTETNRRVIVRTDTGHGVVSGDANVDLDNHQGHDHNFGAERNVGTEADYQRWLNQNPSNRASATNYENFLVQQLGKGRVPPMRELLTTARSWQKCGYEPYQVPPMDLWDKMVPTIRLYNELREKNILPPQTQIRSVYRSPQLNQCAGGAPSSKHMTNGAMDIWIPDYEMGSWQFNNAQNKLCQFWIDNGKAHNFGLWLYSTGAIHLDTQGYRKWGGQYSQTGSPCRYIPPKAESLYIDGQGWVE